MNTVRISENGNLLQKTIDNDSNFDEVVQLIKKLETSEIESILNSKVLLRSTRKLTIRIDTYCISVYERLDRLEEALNVAIDIISYKRDPTVIRTIFRICRKLKDYAPANTILTKYPDIIKQNDFNILYELVYYYDYQKNQEARNETLLRIEKSSSLKSIPINKTLINFYLQFGMFEDLNRIQDHTNMLDHKNHESTRFRDEIKETQEGIWTKVRELHSELEHSRQLAAISELTTGISHELGQPITNIRYTIQFYKKIFQFNLETNTVNHVLDSILEETERMGALIKRLAPLTSTKTTIESFDVMKKIRKRIEAENLKLIESNISVYVQPEKEIFIFSDPVKFDQIISNLLVNSIYSINQKKRSKNSFIRIDVLELDNTIRILFEDSGPGVPFEVRKKIFEPFYTTKPPGEGEGLGLFIIWNILKSQGGTISLESNYTRGARFIIQIPKRKE